mgnify:CR=1 FL=1|jgi:hypothetical protein
MKKKYIMGFLLLMIISNILTGIISYKIYQVVSIGKIVNRNLEAGERSVLLIQIIISRLEKKDLKLLDNLKHVHDELFYSYEGSNLRDLLKKYFPEEF